jgi:hypothetical protein
MRFIFLGLVFYLSFGAVSAQSTRRKKAVEINFERYDEVMRDDKPNKKRHHYGFQLGAFSSRTVVNMSGKMSLDNDTILKVSSPSSSGFLLGFIFNVKLSDELWNFRFLPNVSFYERQMKFNYSNGKSVVQNSEAAMFELPFLFKYQAVRRLNSRFYLVGGLSLATQVGGKRDDPRFLNYKRENIEIVYGVGADLYFRYFKFAPEIRFSHGLEDLHKRGNNLFSQSLDRVSTHRVALVLNFE